MSKINKGSPPQCWRSPFPILLFLFCLVALALIKTELIIGLFIMGLIVHWLLEQTFCGVGFVGPYATRVSY